MWKIASLVLLSLVFGCSCVDQAAQDNNKLCTRQGIYFVGNPNDCSRFIFCINNVAEEEIQCPSSASCFDQKSQVCTEPKKCSCKTESNDLIVKYCRNNPDSWFQKVPAEDCSMFYICMGSDRDPIQIRCPNGWHYSRAEEDCVTPLRAGCQSLSRMCNDKSDGFRFPAIDCWEFYECNDDKPTMKTCPFGQYYDGNASKCVAAEDSQCINAGTSTSVSPPTTVPTCSVDGQIYPHNDCDKFYICINKYPTVIYCNSGYFYNPVLMVCTNDVDGICQVNKK